MRKRRAKGIKILSMILSLITVNFGNFYLFIVKRNFIMIFHQLSKQIKQHDFPIVYQFPLICKSFLLWQMSNLLCGYQSATFSFYTLRKWTISVCNCYFLVISLQNNYTQVLRLSNKGNGKCEFSAFQIYRIQIGRQRQGNCCNNKMTIVNEV